jgi:hypothetical protein
VTPSAAAVATAASAALPPRRSTSIPIAVASGSTLATAPPDPIASACRAGVTAAGRALDAATGTAATGTATTGDATTGTARATAPSRLQRGTDLAIVTSVRDAADRGPNRFAVSHRTLPRSYHPIPRVDQQTAE